MYISDIAMIFGSFLEMVARKIDVTGGYVRPVTERANTSCFDETYETNDLVVRVDVTDVLSSLWQSAALDVLGRLPSCTFLTRPLLPLSPLDVGARGKKTGLYEAGMLTVDKHSSGSVSSASDAYMSKSASFGFSGLTFFGFACFLEDSKISISTSPNWINDESLILIFIHTSYVFFIIYYIFVLYLRRKQ